MINFKNKNTIILSVLAVIIVVTSAVCIYLLMEPKEKPVEIKSLSNVYEKAISSYFDKELTKKDISSISSMEVEYIDDLPFVVDGYLNELTFLKKNENELKKYGEVRAKYLNLLNKEMKKDFKYKKTNEKKITEISKQYDIEYSGFQYMQYWLDLNRISELILQSHYKDADIIQNSSKFSKPENEEYLINTYKSKTKAMELLNSQLKRYRSDEKHTTSLFFEKIDKHWKTSNPLEMYNAFSGGQTKVEMEEHNERFNKILDKTYNKYIHIEEPLKLGAIKKK